MMLYGELPQRARDLQKMLNVAYEQAGKPGLSKSERRALDKSITAMECELETLIGTDIQAYTPGGYYTPDGVMPATGRYAAAPALVLGNENVDAKKKPLPWIIIALIAAGATYYTVKG